MLMSLLGCVLKCLLSRESPLYLSDRLGLRVLDGRGGLHLLHLPGDHNHLEPGWLSANIVQHFLITPA